MSSGCSPSALAGTRNADSVRLAVGLPGEVATRRSLLLKWHTPLLLSTGFCVVLEQQGQEVPVGVRPDTLQVGAVGGPDDTTNEERGLLTGQTGDLNLAACGYFHGHGHRWASSNRGVASDQRHSSTRRGRAA